MGFEQGREGSTGYYHYSCLCGGERIRTAGLLHAKQALSQLSYTPGEEFTPPLHVTPA